MSDQLKREDDELEAGSDAWLDREYAALNAGLEAEEAAEVSNGRDGDRQSEDLSEVGQVGEEPAKTESVEEKPAESSQEIQTPAEGEVQPKTEEPALGSDDYRVPIPAHTAVKRQLRQERKARLQAEEQLAESQRQNEAYKFDAEAEGVELKGQTTLEPMSVEHYKTLVDTVGIEEANAQRIQRNMLIDQQTPTEQEPAPDDQQFTDDEIDVGLESNDEAYRWLMMAKDAEVKNEPDLMKPWEEFLRVESELPRVANETATERYKNVVKAVHAAALVAGGEDPAKAKEVAAGGKPAPARSLDDATGKSRAGSKLDALAALDPFKQVESALADEDLADQIYDAGFG